MRDRDRRLLMLLAFLAAVSGWGVFAAGPDLGLLAHLAPALLVLVPLLLGRYPGERQVMRLVTRGRAVRRRGAGAALCRTPPCAPARQAIPRGLLLGARLAVRPPPAAVPS